MKELGTIYKKSFFGKRYKLNWRAEHLCNAVTKTANLKANDFIVDVGCATGEFVNEFRNRGMQAYGFEGSPGAFDFMPDEIKDYVYLKDLRKPIKGLIKFKVALCLEVAEHIEPEYANQFVKNLTNLSNYIIISAAPPGQKGHGHFNCQPASYWIEKFSKFNYIRQEGDELIFKSMLEQFKRKKGLNSYYSNSMIFNKLHLINN